MRNWISPSLGVVSSATLRHFHRPPLSASRIPTLLKRVIVTPAVYFRRSIVRKLWLCCPQLGKHSTPSNHRSIVHKLWLCCPQLGKHSTTSNNRLYVNSDSAHSWANTLRLPIVTTHSLQHCTSPHSTIDLRNCSRQVANKQQGPDMGIRVCTCLLLTSPCTRQSAHRWCYASRRHPTLRLPAANPLKKWKSDT